MHDRGIRGATGCLDLTHRRVLKDLDPEFARDPGQLPNKFRGVNDRVDALVPHGGEVGGRIDFGANGGFVKEDGVVVGRGFF